MQKQILIVENTADYRQLLQEIVAGMGLTPIVADCATKGVQLLGANQISLVLLDIKMPSFHGDHFLRFIRRQGNNVPVVVVSAYLTPDVLQTVQRFGVRHVVIKPFKVQRLAQVVTQALAGN